MTLPRTEAEVFAAMWDRAAARANGEPVQSTALPGSIDERWDRVLARVYGETPTSTTADTDAPTPAGSDASVDAAWNRVLARTNPTTKIEQRPARWWEPAAAQVTDAPVATTPTVEPVAASSAPPPVLPGPTDTQAASTAEPVAIAPATPPVAEEAKVAPEATGAEPTMPPSVEYFLERCERFRSNPFGSIFRR